MKIENVMTVNCSIDIDIDIIMQIDISAEIMYSSDGKPLSIHLGLCYEKPKRNGIVNILLGLELISNDESVIILNCDIKLIVFNIQQW